MLIVPVAEGLNWRRPPPITALLILLNFFVFFVYQSGDDGRERRAQQAYFDSSLPAIELPLFVEHVKESDPRAAVAVQRAVDAVASSTDRRSPAASAWLLHHMQDDSAFMRELRTARAKAAANPAYAPAYARWSIDRANFETLWGKLSWRRFGFTPAESRPVTWISSLFLHADVMHLVGNMVFLFIVGVAVESALGAGWYLALYLAGGLAANVLFFAINPNSEIPLVGASGAISGLMGLFTVIYGLRQVRFFFWALFFFGFRNLPGLVVLPVWIGYELIQYLFDRGSRVAYIAHAGGLIGGALLGLLAVRRLSRQRVVAFHEEREHEVFDKAEYARARALVSKLDFKAASAAFSRLAQRVPDDDDVLREWYAVAKSDPAGEAFHRVCGLIIARPRPAVEVRNLQARVLVDYLERARPEPRLPSELLAKIGLRMAQHGELAAADRAAEALLRVAPGDDSLPELWDALARAFARRTGEVESGVKAARYAALIEDRKAARPVS